MPGSFAGSFHYAGFEFLALPCLALLACLTPPVAGGWSGGPAWGRDDGVLVCCCCSQFWSPLRRAGRAMCVSRVRVPVLPPVYFAFPAGSWSGLAPQAKHGQMPCRCPVPSLSRQVLLSGGDKLRPAICFCVSCRARREPLASVSRVAQGYAEERWQEDYVLAPV